MSLEIAYQFKKLNFSVLAILFRSLTGFVVSTQFVFAALDRGYDQEMLTNGKSLYQANCAACHGDNAQSTVENWQEPDQDGKMPPPPLNGTAHTWHHPLPGLMQTVRNGTQSIGGNMPPWKEKLNDDEIFSIIVWLTSLWPDELFKAWMQRNQK